LILSLKPAQIFAKNYNMFNIYIGLSLYTVLAKSNENWFFDHKIRELDLFRLWLRKYVDKMFVHKKKYIYMLM